MQHYISVRIQTDNAEGQFRDKKRAVQGNGSVYYQRLKSTELKNEI